MEKIYKIISFLVLQMQKIKLIKHPPLVNMGQTQRETKTHQLKVKR